MVIVGYYILFEGFNGGRTPGKAAFGIQVVSADGTPLTLGAVTLRTLMRLIDFLPAAYAAGAVSIVASPRNQRLGDLVAGTVVIRTRSKATKPTPLPATERQGWDAATVTRDEVALVRRFVERRNELTPETRQRLAADLAGKLRPRVDGGRHLTDEEFLTQCWRERLITRDSRAWRALPVRLPSWSAPPLPHSSPSTTATVNTGRDRAATFDHVPGRRWSVAGSCSRSCSRGEPGEAAFERTRSSTA